MPAGKKPETSLRLNLITISEKQISDPFQIEKDMIVATVLRLNMTQMDFRLLLTIKRKTVTKI